MTIAPATSTKPRLELFLASSKSFADDIYMFGRTVGPRKGERPRSHEEKEDYCLRRWLVAMEALRQLRLPLKVLGYEPRNDLYLPDFVLLWPEMDESLGVEVTEAGGVSFQRWLTSVDGARGAVHWMLRPGEPLEKSKGYVGDQSGRIVIRDVREAIIRKSEKAQKGAYRDISRCDLLIYVNSEGGFMADKAEVVRRLRTEVAKEVTGVASTFQAVHLVFGNNVYVDMFGEGFAEVDVSREYADDWVGWLTAQVEVLRKHKVNAVDFENLSEELESLARRDRRALVSQLQRLLTHFLEWKFQPNRRSNSWRLSIYNACTEVRDLLSESPSLESDLSQIIAKAYELARKRAALETGMSVD